MHTLPVKFNGLNIAKKINLGRALQMHLCVDVVNSIVNIYIQLNHDDHIDDIVRAQLHLADSVIIDIYIRDIYMYKTIMMNGICRCDYNDKFKTSMLFYNIFELAAVHTNCNYDAVCIMFNGDGQIFNIMISNCNCYCHDLTYKCDKYSLDLTYADAYKFLQIANENSPIANYRTH